MIRSVAICLLLRDNDLLVVPYFDEFKNDYFYRSPGGAIRFGESSRQAIQRELKEELGMFDCKLEALGIIENLYNYLGNEFHQHVFVFRGEMPSEFYQHDHFIFKEKDQEFRAIWKSLSTFDQNHRLVPAGIEKLLNNTSQLRIISEGFDKISDC